MSLSRENNHTDGQKPVTLDAKLYKVLYREENLFDFCIGEECDFLKGKSGIKVFAASEGQNGRIEYDVSGDVCTLVTSRDIHDIGRAFQDLIFAKRELNEEVNRLKEKCTKLQQQYAPVQAPPGFDSGRYHFVEEQDESLSQDLKREVPLLRCVAIENDFEHILISDRYILVQDRHFSQLRVAFARLVKRQETTKQELDQLIADLHPDIPSEAHRGNTVHWTPPTLSAHHKRTRANGVEAEEKYQNSIEEVMRELHTVRQNVECCAELKEAFDKTASNISELKQDVSICQRQNAELKEQLEKRPGGTRTLKHIKQVLHDINRRPGRRNRRRNDMMAFASALSGTRQRLCYVCRQKGHIAKDCPQRQALSTSMRPNNKVAIRPPRTHVHIMIGDRRPSHHESSDKPSIVDEREEELALMAQDSEPRKDEHVDNAESLDVGMYARSTPSSIEVQEQHLAPDGIGDIKAPTPEADSEEKSELQSSQTHTNVPAPFSTSDDALESFIESRSTYGPIENVGADANSYNVSPQNAMAYVSSNPSDDRHSSSEVDAYEDYEVSECESFQVESVGG